jgi:MSHA biogenesis protein MshK
MSRVLALVLGVVLCAAAAAQSERLVDPTRPPSAPDPARKDDVAPTAGPQLQSVLISPARRIAVISGQTVVQGGKYGDATVAEITESAVHLRYANRRQTLLLVPGIVKRDRRAGADSNSAKGLSR